MIRRMVYVACNGCGDPAGGNDSFADTAAEARAIAKRNGFIRVRVGGKLHDRCPKCTSTPVSTTNAPNPPEVAPCPCPQPLPSYFCPTSGEVESPCHGGFDVCCDRPNLHRPVTGSSSRKEPGCG